MTGRREAIYSALFGLVSAIDSFVTVTRRVKVYADIDQATQPALLLVELGESWALPAVPPQTVTLKARLFLYCESNDPTAPVSPQLNTLIDAVVEALAPADIEEHQTLGGLVYSVAIAGEIAIAEGLSGQSEAMVPVEIILGG